MNVPYFIWKALFIIGKRLDKKVNFKIYDVQTGIQRITINIYLKYLI